MIIRSKLWSQNFEQWGFEITEYKSSNGKTKGNWFDLEIAGLLRINLVRNIDGPFRLNTLSVLGSPAVWAREVCLSYEYGNSSICAIFARTNITGRTVPIYRNDYLPTITDFSPSHTENFETQDRAQVTPCQVHAVSSFTLRHTPTDWAKSLRLNSSDWTDFDQK